MMLNPLNYLDTMELLNKIEAFKKIDLKTTSMEEIAMKSLEVLSCMIVSSCILAEGSRLYRVRKLKADLSNMPRLFQDIWHPKAELVTKDGRVNLKGQPMLYCSTEQITPLHECGIVENDYFALIQYSINVGKSLMGYTVGNDGEPEGLDEFGKLNNKIINDFIISEFTKPVGIGTEYLYKVSNVIAQNFMDMPFCDAYIYPSIANYKKGWNVAVKPDSAKEKVKFDCVLICKLKRFDAENNMQFEVLHKANNIIDNSLVYVF